MGRIASEYAWALWLAAPLLVTIVAAAAFWWRGRDRSGPSVRAAISDHHRFLDTLAVSTFTRGERLFSPGPGQNVGDGDGEEGADSASHELTGKTDADASPPGALGLAS